METLKKTYKLFRTQQASNVLRQKEIPIEHYISLPMPAIINNTAAYFYFACPTRKIVEADKKIKVDYGKVDRVWAISAEKGALLKYELVNSTGHEDIGLIESNKTIPEMKNILAAVENLMDELSPEFFNSEKKSDEKKRNLLDDLMRLIPTNLFFAYKQYNREFFTWLEN